MAEDAVAASTVRSVTVTATLDAAARPADTQVTILVGGGTAVAGTDYTAVSSFPVTIAAGSTSGTGTFTLAPVDDNVDEPDETVLVRGTTTASGLLVAPTAGVPVTIADDDATPAVTLVLTPDSISEDGGSSRVSAVLDRASSETTTVTVSTTPVSPAVAGDYTPVGTTLTIAAGDMTSTGTVRITANDNDIDAPNREVTVSASAVNDQGIAQPAAQRLTITDDEQTSTTVTLTLLAERSEGGRRVADRDGEGGA